MKWVLVLFQEVGVFSCRNHSLAKAHQPALGVAVEGRVKKTRVIPRAVFGKHQFGKWVA